MVLKQTRFITLKFAIVFITTQKNITGKVGKEGFVTTVTNKSIDILMHKIYNLREIRIDYIHI